MAPHQYPSTCLSDRPHDHRVSDVRLHFSGCLRISKRRRFYESLPPESQARIRRDNEKTTELRHRLETTQCDSTAASRLRTFQQAMVQWSAATGHPNSPAPPQARTAYLSSPDLVNHHVQAPVFYFRAGHPVSLPTLRGQFPNQKLPVADLLADDPSRNPLMQPCDPSTVRYFHLPANNMLWVEEAIARYYHEPRPDLCNPTPRGGGGGRRRTRTEALLRPEYWRGQQNYDPDCAEVHARHMRPLCGGPNDRNLVLFMPYLHWETDRGRVKSDKMVKEAHLHNVVTSISEVVSQAREQKRLSRVQTEDTLAPVLGEVPEEGLGGVEERRRALGRVLRTAAALMEAMDSHNEEMLVLRYLHAQPPLHPRRTLDQSYYGALKSTRARDRDQVVYRGTVGEGHDCVGMDACERCNEDIRKVPRIIMVDQLWLWVLDESELALGRTEVGSELTQDRDGHQRLSKTVGSESSGSFGHSQDTAAASRQCPPGRDHFGVRLGLDDS